MSQDVRQSNLFAAEDFTKVYKSFKDVDFRAYDFDTLKQAMIDYLVLHYPEDFNDYVESSEYIAMIELLAYLGTSLAFRMDLNSRENFMDTAERRESVIRLARMINYQPKRNLAANGLFKLVGIETTEPVTDSLGRNLANVTIFWNDPNNIDSFDQFITVANAAFVNSNPFGKPFKRGTIGSIPTDLYQLNNVKNVQVAYPVPIYVNNEELPFDIVNVDFDDNEDFYERHPDPADAFHIIYRNDGQGLASANTGFFLYFRQGSLINVDNRFEFPIENRIQEIDIQDINNDDVYVQEIDEEGAVQEKWTPVPDVVGNENVYFNPIDADIRTIYGIITGQDDTISLQFADGNFGDVPRGIFRTWVRSSANKNFTLRPDEAQNLEILIPYVGEDTQTYNLRLLFSLEESISNSSPSETNEEVKNNSPQVYYTQDRMVNNEDYNVFPLSRGNEIAKLRTINRTHAGHSRYIDINDPTGFHQNLLLISDDGALYKDQQIPFVEIEINDDINEERTIANTTLENFLRDRQLTNFFYDDYLLEFRRIMSNITTYLANGGTYNQYNVYQFLGDYRFQPSPNTVKNNTGYFINNATDNVYNNDAQIGNEPNYGFFKLFDNGCKVKFSPTPTSTDYVWVTILAISSGTGDVDVDGQLMTFDVEAPRDWVITEIVPKFRRDFTQEEIDNIAGEIERRNNFGIQYNVDLDAWIVFNNPDTDSVFQLDVLESSWLVLATYFSDTSTYEFRSRGTRYIFESYRDVRFFFDTTQQKNFNIEDLTADLDEIEILETNHTTNAFEVWNNNGAVWLNSQNSALSYPNEFILLKDRTVNDSNSQVFVNGVSSGTLPNVTVSDGIVNFVSGTVINGDSTEIRYLESNTPMDQPAIWNLFNPIFETDGYLNPAKVEVIPADTDRDGIPDEPFLFRRVVSSGDLVFIERFTDIDQNETLRIWVAPWLDMRGQVVDNSSVPYPNFTYDDLVAQDLFLVIQPDLQGFQDSVNVRIADQVLQSSDQVQIESDLIEISDNSVFAELVVGSEIVTEPVGGFAPMSAFVPDNDALDELILMRTSGGYLDTSTIPPTFIIVDWTNETERTQAVDRMQSLGILPQVIEFPEDENHFVRNGRSFSLDENAVDPETLDYKWRHYAPADHRIDPSISNIMDMLILTNTYYDDVILWKDSGRPESEFPEPPTTENLRVQFGDLNDYKMLSDQIIFGPAKFKLLFGSTAQPELQALFKVVKVPTTLLTDNEIKSKTVEAIDEFFSIDNWDFGETFYFTELAAFIHKQLAGVIGSVVLVPTYRESQFGDLFQVQSEPNELFLSTATVSNVEIVNTLTETNMRL